MTLKENVIVTGRERGCVGATVLRFGSLLLWPLESMKRKYQTTMESFTRGSRNGSEGGEDRDLKWHRDGGLLWGVTKDFVVPEGDGELKVAGYDADQTLVTTLTGKGHAKHGHDWKLLHSRVTGKLQEEHDCGAVIVIFTNQSGVSTGMTPEGLVRVKMNGIALRLKVPCAVYASLAYDGTRKPAIGMWTHFVQQVLKGRKVDMKRSFYVGDAAGRPKRQGSRRPADFADSDRKFALNIGIGFHTPEEYFDGDSDEAVQDLPLQGVDPHRVITSAPQVATEPSDALKTVEAGEQQVLVLIGYPGSGKSTFATKTLEKLGVVRVNMDKLGNKAKCLQLAESMLEEGKSVVIDNTNPRPDSRAPFIDLARKRSIPARYILPISHAHLPSAAEDEQTIPFE